MFTVLAILIGGFGGLVLPQLGSAPDPIEWAKGERAAVLVEERLREGDRCRWRDEWRRRV